MKKIIFPFLAVCILVLSSCMKKGENIESYGDEPAIVGLTDLFKPLLITRWGTFVAPELQDKIWIDVMEGDLLWTYFKINYDQQPSKDYTIV